MGLSAAQLARVQRGDVIKMRLARDKGRPAVVIRSNLYSHLSYVTILPFTTFGRRDDIDVRITVEPTPANGLERASQVMVDWPQTVRATDLDGVIGSLDRTTMARISAQLAVILGFGES